MRRVYTYDQGIEIGQLLECMRRGDRRISAYFHRDSFETIVEMCKEYGYVIKNIAWLNKEVYLHLVRKTNWSWLGSLFRWLAA